MDVSPKQFVENWNIVQVLGEGAYGKVKLLVHQHTQQAVAVKIINLDRSKDTDTCIDKEIRIHRVLVHSNIVRLFGKRIETDKIYIFMEYAAGGELFNRIEPDVGMPKSQAQSFMSQILAGLQYMHSKGITHRDIKPENLLLDEYETIKISDFGMATVFRLKGRERILDKRCGTLPYVAPEVLGGEYRAEPADIWSCGIVLLTMLAGELPWNEPTDESEDYERFKKESGLLYSPWSKLDNVCLSLARKILTPDPKNRPTLDQILQHPFFTTNFTNDVVDSASEFDRSPGIVLSQPISTRVAAIPNSLELLLMANSKPSKAVCFSQPTNNEDLILGSQIQFTQSPVNHSNFQRLIKRMTRFFVKTNTEETIKRLGAAVEQLHCCWTINAEGTIIIDSVNSQKLKLCFRGNLIHMDGKLMVDFQLGKGCGLEFKRKFVKIKELLKDIIIFHL